MLFHLSFLLWSYLRQEEKCVIYSFMSPIMEVSLQPELTECLVNPRQWLLRMGANLIGNMCWGLREPQSCWRNMPITNSICCVLCSVQSLCHAKLCSPMDCSMTGLAVLHNSWSLGKVMSIELVIPSNHLILCQPLLLLPSIFPSNRVVSNESVFHISWPKYWRLNFSINPSNEYSVLISFRMTGSISLQSKRLSRVLPNTTVQNHQFFIAHHSLWCNCHIHTWQLEKS